MRKTKRFLAFALAFMMFMSNTVSASATAVSQGSAVKSSSTATDGSVGYTTVNSGGDQNSTAGDNLRKEKNTVDPASPDEPSGEDASSQDGGINTDAGGSSVTDGTSASSEAGSSETGSSEAGSSETGSSESGSPTDPSTEGSAADGSSTEGSSVDGSAGDGTEETTTEETVEETTEEETTEVLEAEKLKGETSDVHTTQQEGDIVCLTDDNDNPIGYFASIAAAIDYADELARADQSTMTYYDIKECSALSETDQAKLTVTGDDLVAEYAVVCLYLKHDLTITKNGTSDEDNIVSSNIFLDGDSKVTAHVDAGVTLQILKEGWRDIAISFSKSEKGTLILGEKGNTNDSDDLLIYMDGVTVENAADLKVYAPVRWNSRFTKNENGFTLTDAVDMEVEDLTIAISENISDRFYFYGSIKAENVTLASGAMNITDLTVKEAFTASENTRLYLLGDAEIANLKVNEKTDDGKDPFAFYCVDTYKDSKSADTRIKAASVNISGKAETNYNMWMTRYDYIEGWNGTSTYHISDQESCFEEGDTSVTVTAENMDAIDSSLLDIHAYGANTDSSQAFCLEPSETNVPGKYALKVTKDYEGIRLYMSKGEGENLWEYEKGFETLADVKNYINTKNDSDMEYIVNLSGSMTLENADDLDYSSVPAKGVAVNLYANTLTVKKDTKGTYSADGYDAVISADGLYGHAYDNEGMPKSNTYAKIDLKSASDISLAFIPRKASAAERGDMDAENIRVLSNNARLYAGSSKKDLYADLQLDVTGSLRKLELYGDTRIQSADTLTAENVTVQENADLHAGQITVTGKADVKGTVTATGMTLTGARLYARGAHIEIKDKVTLNNTLLELQGTLETGTLIMAASRIHVGKDDKKKWYGNLYADTVTVNSAYAGDASGDRTLENESNILVKNTLTMKAGTLYNRDVMEVKTAAVKDMINAGSFLCDQFTNTGSLTLEADSAMLINRTGTVNNVILEKVDHGDGQGNASLGRAGEAKVTFKGTFKTKQEDGQVNAFVTDAYLTKIGDGQENVENEGTDNERRWTEYTFDRITLWDDNATPDDDSDDHDAEHVKRLDMGDLLFCTESTNFPTESINVLPWKYNKAEEGEEADWTDNENNTVYRSGKELLVTGSCIHVSVEHAGGESAGEAKDFSTWQDAVTYIDTVNNASAVYRIEISARAFDIGGVMTLPTKASKVVIASAIGHEEDEGWFAEQIRLLYQGDITQKTDLTFENILLVPYKMVGKEKVSNDAGSTVNTNGKTLELNNTAVCVMESGSTSVNFDGRWKAIKGSKTTTLRLLNGSGISVNDTITGIDRVEVLNGSNLNIENGGLSVNCLYTENEEEYQKKDPYACSSINVRAEKGVLEVKDTFDMASKTSVYSAGTMKFKNISTNCEGNVFYTENADSITITGSVYSWDKDALLNTAPYVAVTDASDNILGYRKPADEDYKDHSIEGSFKDDITVIRIPEYAIFIDVTDETNDILATAAGVSSSWFFTEKYVEEAREDLITPTRKENDKILRGEKSAAVTLYEVKGEDENGQITAQLGQFATLQEAFSEIDKIADSKASYLITLNETDDPETVSITAVMQTGEVNVADRNENARGKTVDYTLPSKAEQVTVRANGDPKAIVYSKNLTLKTDMTFEKVLLYPETATGKAPGTASLGSYSLTLKDSYVPDNQISFTGNGTAKTSGLILTDTGLYAAKCSQIARVELESSQVLTDGEIVIGDLIGDDLSVLAGLNKITVNTITAKEDFGPTVYTKPKFTKDSSKTYYTKAEPMMTVTGNIEGTVEFYLFTDEVKAFTDISDDGFWILEQDAKVLTKKLLAEGGEGLAFLKAPNAATENVWIRKDNQTEWTGHIYKKSGNFVYKDSKPQVQLSYTDGLSGKVTYELETFADAVNEINTLKTKRDYTIKFLSGDNADPATKEKPITLTMPKAGMVDTLTLTSKGSGRIPAKVYFKGDITFNSGVVLDNIYFVQVMDGKGVNYEPKEYAQETGKYANPLNVKVNGAYTLEVKNYVFFNNALALNGGNKATLTVQAGCWFSTKLDNLENISANGKAELEGTIKNFALVQGKSHIELYPYLSGTKEKAVYKPAEVNVTALDLAVSKMLEVGDYDSFYGSETIKPVISTLAVKKLDLEKGAVVAVYGTASVADADLSTGSKIYEYGQSFTITGTLTVSGNAEFYMALKPKSTKEVESALNISGKVVREDENAKVTVEVITDYYRITDLDPNKRVTQYKDDDADIHHLYLGGYYYNTKGEKVAISKKLLTAANADASIFIAKSYCLESNNNEPYNTGTGRGYFLSKTGKDILVHYGDEVEAALYVNGSTEVYNYYTSFNEAVAAIDALKNTNAEYTIRLLQDVGSAAVTEEQTNNVLQEAVYEKVNLPAKAAKVTVTSDVTSASAKRIFFNNNFSLGMDVEFKDVTLVPQKPASQSIKVNGHALTLDNVVGKIGTRWYYGTVYEEGEPKDEAWKTNDIMNSFCGLDGGGKDSTITVKNCTSSLWILGKMTNVTNYIQQTNTVFVKSEVSITNFTFMDVPATAASENPSCQFDTEYAKVTITNIDNKCTSSTALLQYGADKNRNPYLTIKGNITNASADNKVKIEAHYEVKPFAVNGNGKVTLSNQNKLLVMEKETPDKAVYSREKHYFNFTSDNVCWADKGIYLMPYTESEGTVTTDYTAVPLEFTGAEFNCLDLAQATNFINARADRDTDYYINLTGDITDTCVTDGSVPSKLTLPGKDKMYLLYINGGYAEKTPTLSFTGDLAVNGKVYLNYLNLKNDKDFSITMAANSDVKTSGSLTEGESYLDLSGVQVLTTTNGNKTVGNLKNITGTKDRSCLEIYADGLNLTGNITQMEEVNLGSDRGLNLSGGFTKVNTLGVGMDSFVVTKGTSDVKNAILDQRAKWTTLGKTTVENVAVDGLGATLGTTLVKGVPQLTVTGDVNGSYKTLVKLYEVTGGEAKEYESDDYENTPLLIAKKASADKFMAYRLSKSPTELEDNIVAYKDAKNYVYNGDLSKMEAKVTSMDDSGNTIGTSYAKTYADAITLINNMGNKDGEYTLCLRRTDANGGTIKTAVDKDGNAVYGALALPKAGAAKSLTIRSEGSSYSDQVTVKYTGTLSPAGRLDLTFGSIYLTEGKVNTKADDGFDATNMVTLNIGSADVTFLDGARTPVASQMAGEWIAEDEWDLYNGYYDMVFSKITSGSGTLHLDDNYAFVTGNVSVANLECEDTCKLRAKGSIKITNTKTATSAAYLYICTIASVTLGNVSGKGYVDITTAYTKQDWKKAQSQLTISGTVSYDTKIYIYPFFYDKTEDGYVYKELTKEEQNDLLWDGNTKPAAYQKLFTAPKMSLNDKKKIYLGSTIALDTKATRYNGGIYYTDGKINTPITVKGYDGGNQCYHAKYSSWEQAVKEIDTLNQPTWEYYIKLTGDIGTDGTPLKNLTMPAKASYINVSSDNDSGILMTGTTITLKTRTLIDVPITAVKKSGSRYYSTPYTINVGKYKLELYLGENGRNYTNADGENIGYFEPQMKLTGTAQAEVGIVQSAGDHIDCNSTITQISNIGVVELDMHGVDHPLTYSVKDGVSGVGTLVIKPTVSLECENKDVNVKNLVAGLMYDWSDKEPYYDDRYSDQKASVTAPNITVSNTLSMAGSELRAGVSTGSDGKVTLKDIVVYDNDNSIYAKQDKSGKSQIKITGTVTPTGNHIRSDESAITLGLYYHNSTSRFAQLTDGMVFANAPKAATSMFRVNSAWEYTNDNGEQVTEMNMGFVPSTEIFEKMTKDGKQISTTADYDGTPILETDEVGNPIIAMDEEGNYIQGEGDPHYVLATDGEGNPVFVTDDGGNKIQATGKDGQPLTDGDGNPVYLCVFYETVNYFEDTYGLYRLGNDIVYGKRMDLDWDTQEWTSDKEVRVWIDGEPWETSYLDFATFEEAVKAIDSMGLQKDVTGANGKTAKSYLDYTIQLRNNVQIGNEKQNNKYNALSLPTKAKTVTIDGMEKYGITFSGKVTLKSDTVFKDITLNPVRLVKNELISDKPDFTAGRYQLTLLNVDDNSKN